VLEKSEGREVLQRVFEEAGYRPIPDYTWNDFKLDGFDPEQRTGYEYVTLAEPDQLQALDRLNEQGEARLFLVDELLIRDAEELAASAREFLRRNG
jgi:hypothetical protein